MKKFFAAFVALTACLAFAVLAGCKDNEEQKKPEKIKDGIALVMTAGESKSIDLSEYISIEGTEYAYTAESSDNSVATVAVDGNSATVTAVKEGSAEITASADETEVKFAVTVNKKAEQPEEKPAPVFGNKSLSYDLKDKQSGQITLAPESGDSSFIYSYALKTEDASVTIEGNKLTAAYASATEKTLTVVATYTVGTDSSTAKTVEFNVTVTVTDTRNPAEPAAPELKESAVVVEKDLFNEEDSSFTIDFAENVKNPDGVELRFEVKNGEEVVPLTNTSYNFVYGTYDETVTTVVYSVKIYYNTDGELEYTYTLKIKDTTSYRAVNGNFDNDLDGWTIDGDIGAISENGTFWEQGYPVFNVGKYFMGDGKEGGTGTLKSPLFKVGGVNKISFKLGAAGNKDCYITLEKVDGTVLAIWRNIKFEDIHEGWDADEIGKTQFACNLVTYVADLTAYAGETVRIVLNDNATKDFGFFNFDELATYYATAEEVPAGIAAENELADKTALQAAVDEAISGQGDYTEESYNAYTEKLEAATAALDKVSATQEEVNTALSELQDAENALEVRKPTEKPDADKNVALLVSENKELTISDYVDENGLSDITYTAEAADQKLIVSPIDKGKFTVSASEELETTVTITVLYKGKPTEPELTVTLEIKVTDGTPTVKQTEKVKDIDLYSETNTTDITLDFAENISNPAALTLSYTVTKDGGSVELTDTSCYTLTYGEYTETATVVEFSVQVEYTLNDVTETLSYTYTLNIKDTTAYRVKNGDFDHGTQENGYLDGWTLSNAELGAVNEQAYYWVGDSDSADGYAFGNEKKFFNAYATDKESATGTLKSSVFKVSKSGWITYKLGGAKNIETVTFEIVSATDETKRAVLPNFDWSDVKGESVRGCSLVAYKANLQSYGFAEGESVYILVTDNGIGDYGLFFLDSVVTYYTQEPTGDFNLVAPTRLLNGGFEFGNLTGWTLTMTETEVGDGLGVVTDTEIEESWYQKNDSTKDGKYLFTFYYRQGEENVNVEHNTGTLRSSTFVLKKNGIVSFRLGAANNKDVYINLCKANGEVLATFRNNAYDKATEMVQYYYQCSNAEDTSCYFEVVDNAKGDYGCIVMDDFRVNLDSIPEGAIIGSEKTKAELAG